MKDPSPPPARDADARRLAEAVRAACLDAVLRGYEDAKISGLCHEGAWECAVGALRALDVEQLVARDEPNDGPVKTNDPNARI